MEGVGGGGLQGHELLADLRGVARVRGGPLGAQGGLGHGVGDEVVHLPGDLQAHVLQPGGGALGVCQPGGLRGAQEDPGGEERERHEDEEEEGVHAVYGSGEDGDLQQQGQQAHQGDGQAGPEPQEPAQEDEEGGLGHQHIGDVSVREGEHHEPQQQVGGDAGDGTQGGRHEHGEGEHHAGEVGRRDRRSRLHDVDYEVRDPGDRPDGDVGAPPRRAAGGAGQGRSDVGRQGGADHVQCAHLVLPSKHQWLGATLTRGNERLEAVRLTKSWRALESVPTAGVMGVMGSRRDGVARRIAQIAFGCPSMSRLRMTVTSFRCGQWTGGSPTSRRGSQGRAWRRARPGPSSCPSGGPARRRGRRRRRSRSRSGGW